MVDVDVPSRTVVLAERLERAATWLREHPGEQVYLVEAMADGQVTLSNYAVRTAADIAEVVRRIGGRWDKEASGDLFCATREVRPGVTYRLVAYRGDVCERVVVATRQVEVDEPDPAAVAALPTVRQTRTEEIVEWRCPPLLVVEPEPVEDDLGVLDEVPF